MGGGFAFGAGWDNSSFNGKTDVYWAYELDDQGANGIGFCYYEAGTSNFLGSGYAFRTMDQGG
ncbi:hypothetical protein BTH42_31615 [Burkholderia sp. SRS-W-2-2016]|nr:hypothetical protein BTH42_31615 [Burkholderia sp. SRS-W-2-2016]